jgi:phage antirepressor YoqD-like protein
MNKLIKLNESGFMNSLDFLNEIINPERLKAGEPEVKNTHFSARIEDELDELPAVKIIYRFGNEMRTYDLTVDQMTLIGMRESKSVRRNILEILKRMDKPKLPQTYAEALLEAGRLALENEKQAEQLRLAAPKVEFVEKYIDSSTGSLGFRKVAKLLKVNEKSFRAFLNDEKIMYKLGGDWVPYQNHIDAGRFEVKAGLAEHEESSHAFTQSKFTAKGVEWVAGEYAKSLVRDATKV